MGELSRRKFLENAGVAGIALGLGSKLARAADPLKVGVVYAAPVGEVGWTRQQQAAVDHVKAQLGNGVEFTIIENIFQPQDAERVFRELVSAGNKLVIGTTFSHAAPLQKVAPRFPEVAFECAAGITALDNLGVFDARTYEGSFVAGVAAGHVSKSAKIGFIGGFPIPSIIASANALLMGARSVNPDVTCNALFLNSWFDPGKEKEAAKALLSQGCDVIYGKTETVTSVQTAGESGAWSIGDNNDMSKFGAGKQLTACTLDWSGNYMRVVQAVSAGNWKAEARWEGFSGGVVKMAPYNESLPADVVAKLKQIEADIASGKMLIFAGQLKDQAGNVKVETGSALTDAEIRSMDWFVNGVIGERG